MIAGALLTLAPGCANKFYTVKLDPAPKVAKNSTGKHAQQIDYGVIVYQPKLKRVTYQYTAREDDAGNMIATADGKAMGRLCEAAPVFDHMEDAR